MMKKMSMKQVACMAGGVALATTAAMGCSVPEDGTDEAPAAEMESLGEQASMSFSANGGTYTATANAPLVKTDVIRGGFTLQGPNQKVGAGACLVAVSSSVTCSGNDDSNQLGYRGPCSTLWPNAWINANFPGGYRYCAKVNGAGSKFCMLRPGRPKDYCAGTPALADAAGAPPGPAYFIYPGTYNTPYRSPGLDADYVSYACLQGCTTSDPSVSSTQTYFETPTPCTGGPPCPI